MGKNVANKLSRKTLFLPVLSGAVYWV